MQGLSCFFAFAMALGCSPTPAMPDAATGDDAATAFDAGSDAGVELDSGSGTPRSCVTPEGADPSGTDAFVGTLGRSTVSIDERGRCHRTYTMTSTAVLRDDEPDDPRSFPEQAGWPTLRSGHDMFDALHALAIEETRELSVASIRDASFDDGRAVDCGGCFETGRLWSYVWTRDTAYAVELGLAVVDPARARASMEFKLSERRGGGDLQIVQDTGTGGSYPISSDRVSWAVGAVEVLNRLDGPERDAFRDRALSAISNTLEHDRRIVYDATDGLYRGEQSFLDWREQTYSAYTADDVVHIGMSRALSTNLLHFRAMQVASRLADEVGDGTRRDRYAGWADELRTAIRARFWLEDEGLFSTYLPTGLDPTPVRRYDLLGSAFAVLFGVADASQATRILERYPHYGPGAPVIWPQQQATRIYHNRGEWPFVTAYWLRAAKVAGNDAVMDRMVNALVRGAALNLSNMENFEAASGAPWLDDGTESGPVVNSQRQLWSVAGYLSMVHHTLFGLEAEADGLHVRPGVTAGLRDTLFAGTGSLVLNDYPYRGRTITVVLHLPGSAGTGVLSVRSMTLNAVPVTGDLLTGLDDGANRVDVVLGAGSGGGALTEVGGADWRNVFGPQTPRIAGVSEVAGRLRLALSTAEPSDVTWRIYRDGVVVADGLPGSTTSWDDPFFDASSPRSPCYSAELTFTSSDNHSQHAPPFCWWGAGASRITTIDASAMMNVGGTGSSEHGRFHYEPWGDAGDSLTVPSFRPTQTGTHLLQVTFGNGAGGVTTGITCGVKRIVVENVSTGTIVAEGPVLMPHLGTWTRWEDSSFVRAELRAGTAYRIVIRSDDDAVNMSSFAHFELYTGGLGGRSGVFNRVNIAELNVLAL